MGNFNERSFLLRALVTVFVVQFATVFYQIYSCQTAINSRKEVEKVTLICSNASNSFNETGKIALATFLALLVPAGPQTVSPGNKSAATRRKVKGESDTEVDDNKVG